MAELSLERRMREADVGSQSADTVKFGFRLCSNLWKQSLRTRRASKATQLAATFISDETEAGAQKQNLMGIGGLRTHI